MYPPFVLWKINFFKLPQKKDEEFKFDIFFYFEQKRINTHDNTC